ncbi:PIR protein [Plasmodium ovale]|uniref:PIR Superfamily Protein n=2 Tax=Plasmodium ovale TaxID=36330 RepID=A0A1A8XD06_PLAOA|nr:PIR Superfamily Protein [Plasmodium ovale curtisi]SBT84121.1 PIR protein [Plasmodium ovale]
MLSEREYTSLLSRFGYSRKELFSERFYQERDIDISELSKYSKHCDVKVANQYKEYVNEICKKVLKYLEKSEKWEKNESKYDECILLNYWVYDMLDKYFHQNTEQMDISFSGLQYIWGHLTDDSRKTSYYNKCRPLFKEILKYNDWKKRKELYDYYIDYDTLSGTAKSFDEQCDEYYKIIEAKKSLYKHFENACLSHEYNCPDIYDKCIDYNPEKVLPTLKCHHRITAERGAASELAAKTSAMKHAPEQGLGYTTDFHGTESMPESSQIGTKVGQSVLGVAPVLLTASALYRYTPIGSWIRKLGGINQKSLSNMDDEEMNGFLSNTQGSGDTFFENTENYISYQPM